MFEREKYRMRERGIGAPPPPGIPSPEDQEKELDSGQWKRILLEILSDL
jgi:hypothetical protein